MVTILVVYISCCCLYNIIIIEIHAKCTHFQPFCCAFPWYSSKWQDLLLVICYMRSTTINGGLGQFSIDYTTINGGLGQFSIDYTTINGGLGQFSID